MNTDDKGSAIEVFRDVSKRALRFSLGESAGEAVLFFLHRSLGRDPFDALWDDPKSVYHELEKIFGVGTKVLINLLIMEVKRKYGLNMSPERFLELMRSGDQMSIEEIRSFIRKVAETHRCRGDMEK